VFVAIEDTRLVDRIDTKSNRVTARWPIPSCDKPHGVAADPAHDRLFISCENGIMLALDSDNGKVLAGLTIGYGSDSAAFDPRTELAFSSNRDGTLSVIKEASADNFADLGSVHTELGARTMAVDPATGRVFTMTEAVAQVLSQEPETAPDLRYEPGTLHMLFYDPPSSR
jgi:DNA-binding beta-propeller fold protein YncE